MDKKNFIKPTSDNIRRIGIIGNVWLIISVLLMMGGMLAVLSEVLARAFGGHTLNQEEELLLAFTFITGIIGIISTIGFKKTKEWARKLGILFSVLIIILGVLMALSLISYFIEIEPFSGHSINVLYSMDVLMSIVILIVILLVLSIVALAGLIIHFLKKSEVKKEFAST